MAKTTSQSQGSFSFFDDLDKANPAPEPKKHVLKPPAQIEAVDEELIQTEKAEETPVVAAPEADFVEDVVSADDNDDATGVEAEKDLEEGPADDFHETTVEEEEIVEEMPANGYAGEIMQEKRSSRGRKSVKEHSLAAEMIEMPGDEVLYAKQYYSMGEVTSMFKENHSLIRYWESEFDILRPKKNGKGDRFFRPVDVKNLYLIYDLLRRRKFTIEGARDYLKNNKKADEKFAAVQSLEKIKAFFLELKASL
ncbi:MerR family transcriptional regulator [Niabella yanshanensis]|uniref:MerR family transcriptional regulator n=1 Tax=Niabella yanshanensis TaxID=577386 RepID=A0ABZ0W0X2_9BACT|nr:MerR family transcriptional regulator [Niabella yanshanensis]WQD36721.1 MerR family transcriptional regulator [Niabella yanshanensis]